MMNCKLVEVSHVKEHTCSSFRFPFLSSRTASQSMPQNNVLGANTVVKLGLSLSISAQSVRLVKLGPSPTRYTARSLVNTGPLNTITPPRYQAPEEHSATTAFMEWPSSKYVARVFLTSRPANGRSTFASCQPSTSRVTYRTKKTEEVYNKHS